MKVTKTTIHKMEIERPCGCKVAGDYEDPAYKKTRGDAVFTACEKHKEAPGLDMLEEMLREVLEKEAREAKAPEVIHPRTAALQSEARAETGSDSTSDQPVARTLRTAGSSGTAGREQHRPASAPARPASGGVHRPTPKPSGASPFRRSDPNSGLSVAAQSKVAASASVAMMDMDMGPAAEDTRVTRVLEDLNLFDDEGRDDE